MDITFESSELNWPAGFWADEIRYEGKKYLKGETHRDNEGDITFVEYVSPNGQIIKVFND